LRKNQHVNSQPTNSNAAAAATTTLTLTLPESADKVDHFLQRAEKGHRPPNHLDQLNVAQFILKA